MAKRPLGITLLAAYLFLSALVSVFVSYTILTYENFDYIQSNIFIGDVMEKSLESGVTSDLRFLWAGYILIGSIINFILSYGLFSMKKWVLYLYGFGVILNIILFFTFMPNILTIIISAIFLAYVYSKKDLLK